MTSESEPKENEVDFLNSLFADVSRLSMAFYSHTGVGHHHLHDLHVQSRRARTPPNNITCPVCKCSNHIPDGDVSSLTKNFALLGFKDSDMKAGSRHYCKEHDHEQRIYCRDCQLLVCAYCQLYGRHKSHTCLIATEACKPAVEEVKTVEAVVSSELQQVEAGENAVLARIKKLDRGKAHCERSIARYYNRLTDMLQQKKESEIEKVRMWADEQAYVLQAQLR